MDNMESKGRPVVEAPTELDEFDNNTIDADAAQKYDPKMDARDMTRLGRRQELKRRFRFFSIVGYVVVLGLTWEYTLATSIFTLNNGGTAGSIWLTFATCVGMCMVMLSFAEMASMAPTAGGQYHWVSEFAPPQYQRILSYIVGWMAALGWQGAMPSVAYIGATQVVSLIAVCEPSYTPKGWHYSLLTMAFTLCAIFFNTYAIGRLTTLEGVAVVLHVFGFFAFVIVFWVMGPRADAKVVFTQFSNDNGWSSVGLAVLVGIVGPTATYLGSDSAVHLAEELRDASYTLPRAMCVAAAMNYILGFIMTVTLMFNLGDLEADSASSTGQVWVAIIQNITKSKAATIVLLLIMIFLFFFCAVNQVTGSSRQLWSFARDRGFPFHRFLSKVGTDGVPTNSVVVTLAVTTVISLIVIGSTSAFNIILSICGLGLFTSYLVVIGVMLHRRLQPGAKFPPSRFHLGILGVPINILAIGFLFLAYIFLFFPAAPNPNAVSMNWAIVVYSAAVIVAMAYYVFKGRHEYDGPVTIVKKEFYESR